MTRERGQITIMTIGFLTVVLMLAVVVVDASHAFLERRELDNLADGAAIAAADGLDEARFYTAGRVEIDARSSRERVARYLQDADVRVLAVRLVDDHVVVRLERTVELVLAPPGFPVRTTIRAEATAQLRPGSDRS